MIRLMLNVFLLIAWLVVIALWFVIRSDFKANNPKHSLFDDILLFTGAPVVFGYILILTSNSDNFNKPIEESFWSPTMIVLLLWMVVSCVLLIVRYYKNRKCANIFRRKSKEKRKKPYLA